MVGVTNTGIYQKGKHEQISIVFMTLDPLLANFLDLHSGTVFGSRDVPELREPTEPEYV